MKDILMRLLAAAALMLVAFVLAPTSHAQQAGQDQAPTPPAQQQSAAPQSPEQTPPQPPSASDPQTQDVLSFTGRVVSEKGQIVLKDPITKLSYKFDDESKAKPYVGKQVKVTGKLDMNSNTIHIAKIAALP